MVLGRDDLLGLVLVGGFEAGAFAGGLVHAIEGAATDAAGHQSVTSRHGLHATERLAEGGSEDLTSSGRVKARYVKH